MDGVRFGACDRDADERVDTGFGPACKDKWYTTPSRAVWGLAHYVTVDRCASWCWLNSCEIDRVVKPEEVDDGPWYHLNTCLCRDRIG
jgi:hypothetical protein